MKNILFLFLFFSATLANGQVVATVGQGQDLFQKNLYSADRVMEMRNELKLTEAQATKIKKIHTENAGKFSTMKWDLDDATLKLKSLLDEAKIDETAVQKQMDKVLAIENSLKKQQLSTMVSIKNELSSEQQEILQGQRVQTVNGVNIVGYGTSSFSSASDLGHPQNFRVGKPLYGTSNSSVSVVVAGSNQPLYYQDVKGKMKELVSLKDINPNDIESMEVLKDEKAVEKFGEKAKNGVIIIKLKEDPKK